MCKEQNPRVFPKNISVEDLLALIEEKVRDENCTLEEAFQMFVTERLRDKN